MAKRIIIGTDGMDQLKFHIYDEIVDDDRDDYDVASEEDFEEWTSRPLAEALEFLTKAKNAVEKAI